MTASPASLTLTPGTRTERDTDREHNRRDGRSTVTFGGTAGALSHTATLALTVQTPPIPDVTTYHFDNSRDGLNAQETVLTPANVTSATFGKIGFFQGDGKVDAQPLYLAGLNVNGTATNVLYMATEHGSLYAFNADTGAQMWKTSLLGSGESSKRRSWLRSDLAGDRHHVHAGDRSREGRDLCRCDDARKRRAHYHQRLHALSLTTGAELAGSPVEISGTYPGTGAGSAERDGSLHSRPICGARRTVAAEWNDLPGVDFALRLLALHGMGDGL